MKSSPLFGPIKTLLLSSEERQSKIKLGVFRGIKVTCVPRLSAQLLLGLWERETYPFIRRAARQAKWMVDIGAGAGELSIYFAKRSTAKPIIAIEPHQPYVVFLRKNLTANNVANRISLLMEYLGTEPEQIRLDSLSLPPGGFIKLDADYQEASILSSGEALLKAAHPALLIETHTVELERECIAFLEQLGYTVSIIKNAWWRRFIPEQRPIPHNRWLWAQ